MRKFSVRDEGLAGLLRSAGCEVIASPPQPDVPAVLTGRDVERIISVAVHDLRNPLNAINGYSELLLEDKEILTESQMRFLERIHEACGEMTRMLTELRGQASALNPNGP